MKQSVILLIEDNAQNRYLTTFLLEHRGYRVVTAADGQEGIETAKGLQPDLILLDIQLPKMDGYSAARSLREDRSLSNTPIIAVTSYAMVGDREKCLAAGCNGYIEKPINPETFVSEIEAFLKRPLINP
jgi:two-component system cell cycle response regulator DivK